MHSCDCVMIRQKCVMTVRAYNAPAMGPRQTIAVLGFAAHNRSLCPIRADKPIFGFKPENAEKTRAESRFDAALNRGTFAPRMKRSLRDRITSIGVRPPERRVHGLALQVVGL